MTTNHGRWLNDPTPPPEGYYIEWYDQRGDSGPYESVRQMADAEGLAEYPAGMVYHVGPDGTAGSVPSLNPDDLLDYCDECGRTEGNPFGHEMACPNAERSGEA